MTAPPGLSLRRARADDVDAIVRLLADDPLGAGREKPGDPLYDRAFAEIAADPDNEIWVVVDADDAVRGTAQLTFIPGLSRLAATRAQIESVRVADALQGQGVGRWLFDSLIARARERGAQMVQLTSDKTRPDALRFYESLGFTASHQGFKLFL